MTYFILIFILIFIFAVLLIRYISNDTIKPAVDLSANIAAAFIGIFLGLAADDHRKHEDERLETIHALLAAQAANVESSRSLRDSTQSFNKILMLPDESRRKLLLQDFDKVANKEPAQSSHISEIFLSNGNVLRSSDPDIIYLIVKQDTLLDKYARIYNSREVENFSRATALREYITTVDDTSMHLCAYQSFIDKKLDEKEYKLTLNFSYKNQPTLPNEFIKSNCQPKFTAADFVKSLYDQAHTP